MTMALHHIFIIPAFFETKHEKITAQTTKHKRTTIVKANKNTHQANGTCTGHTRDMQGTSKICKGRKGHEKDMQGTCKGHARDMQGTCKVHVTSG
ncbi:hypothetical protein AAMO2058_001020400 [Amorphochlora amoebiformis]